MPIVTYPPPWEGGCGAADPALSQNFSSYTGSGYGPKPARVGIGVGNIVAVPPAGVPAQARMFLQGGNLYILDNNGTAYVVSPSAVIPQPANYSPTK